MLRKLLSIAFVLTVLAVGILPAAKREAPAGPEPSRPAATAAQVDGLVARGEYEKAAELIVHGGVQGGSADACNRAGLGLHCGNAHQQKLAIDCLVRAVEMEPDSVYYRYNLGVTYWNAGYLEEAKTTCSKVLEKDPGNVQARQIIERIERSDYTSRVREAAGKRRKVIFTLDAALDQAPRLIGSWNPQGKIDQMQGWASVPMTPVQTAGARGPRTVYRTEVELARENGRWYSAIVLGPAASPGAPSSPPSGPAPGGRLQVEGTPLYFCRFPVYAVTDAPLKIQLDQHPVHPPSPFLAPRRPLADPPAKAEGPPRTILVCIDSDTWDIVMPLVKLGAMPRLAQLMERGSYGVIHSDPPVSTIVFDRINFGKAGTFGWFDLVKDSLETLKERGIDLIHAGDVAGTMNTWRLFAQAGHPSLYVSWAERLFYAKGGAETAEPACKSMDGLVLGGLKVPPQEEKVWSLLDRAEVPAPTKVTYSDGVAEELFDTGCKRFSESIEIVRKRQPRISFVHFGFVDTSYHLFWDAMDCDVTYLRPGYTPPRRHSHVIEGLHRLMDLFIGEYAAEVFETGGNVIVFSDHGAVGGFAKSWLGHVPEGMVVAAGPSFAKGGLMKTVPDISSIVPTLFAIYGMKQPVLYGGSPLPCLTGKAAAKAAPRPAPGSPARREK